MRTTLVAVVVAVGVLMASIGGGYALATYQINQNNIKFCQLLDSVPKPPEPSDPAKNPSRMTVYEGGQRALRLAESLGCEKGR